MHKLVVSSSLLHSLSLFSFLSLLPFLIIPPSFPPLSFFLFLLPFTIPPSNFPSLYLLPLPPSISFLPYSFSPSFLFLPSFPFPPSFIPSFLLPHNPFTSLFPLLHPHSFTLLHHSRTPSLLPSFLTLIPSPPSSLHRSLPPSFLTHSFTSFITSKTYSFSLPYSHSFNFFPHSTTLPSPFLTLSLSLLTALFLYDVMDPDNPNLILCSSV